MADRPLAAHLLRRATFGPTAGEVDAAERVGVAETVAALLRPGDADRGAAGTPLPDLGTDPYAYLPKDPTFGQRQEATRERRKQIRVLERWWLDRMVAAEHQLTEKLVYFWHGHWATSVLKVRSAQVMAGHLETLRRHGTGDFAELVRAMVRDPALIVWLDGQRNTRQAPNENLARELMELFTLGVGQYTEDDVRAGARALTGWSVDLVANKATLVARRHDDTAKTILGETANFDADSYVDLLLRQPAHAPFLAGRFWYRFAAGGSPPAGLAEGLIAAYGPGRNITALVATLLSAKGFAATRGQLVKQPVEWLVGALRQLGLRLADLSAERRRLCLDGLLGLGQMVLRPPSVGGWPAGAAWLTTSSLKVRLGLAGVLAAEAGERAMDELSGGSVTTRVEALARLLSVDSWTDRTRAALVDSAAEPRRLLSVGLASPEYTVC